MSKKPTKNIFVIMPFVKVNGGARNEAQLAAFFENHIKRPIEDSQHLQCEYRVTRSGEAFSITRDIISALCRADIVIADLSGSEPNPNVMYELGVRLAVSSDPVILIREEMPGARNPFDVLVYFTKTYDPLDYSTLEKHLLGKLYRLETGEETFDNEVLRVIREELTLVTPDVSSISPDRQRALILRGIRQLADITRAAYGPLGRGLQVRNSFSSSLAITGKEIAMGLRSNNPFEQEGISILGGAARSIFDKHEDGSKLVILIAAAMIESAADCANNSPGASVANQLTSLTNRVIECLHRKATPLVRDQWPDLATTAAKIESMPSQLLEAIDVLAQGGTVSIEDSMDPGVQLIRQEHYNLAKGVAHEDFLSENNNTTSTLEDALVLLSPCPVESLREVLPILEKVAQTNKPLLFVARSFESQVLTTLRVNNDRGSLKCVPVNAPGFGDRQIGILQDLAALTGATVLDPSAGLSLENATLGNLGSAQRVVITAGSTEIQFGGGKAEIISDRIAHIRSKLSRCSSEYDQEQLGRRLVSLSGLGSTVFVGGLTIESRQLLKRQVRESLGACSLGMQNGSVSAVASLLVRLAHGYSNGDSGESLEPAHKIVIAGMEAPLRALARNAGQDENAVLDAVRNGAAYDGRDRSLRMDGTTSLRDAVDLIAAAVSIASATTSTFLRTSSWIPSYHSDNEADRRTT